MYCRAGFLSYISPSFPSILRRMLERDAKQNPKEVEAIEYRKGCPLCEHSDPELERELQSWAQLLYDHFSSRQWDAKAYGAAPFVDSGRQSPTLKERSKKKSTKIQQA